MKKMLYAKLSVALVIAALCLSLPGQATANGMGQTGIHPYMGIGIGAFGIKGSEPGFSQTNTVFGEFVKAGVDLNKYLAVELRLGSTSKGSQNNAAGVLGSSVPFTTTIQMRYFMSYLAKLQYPMTPDLHIYALLGATTGEYRDTSTLQSPTSGTRTGLSYGIGGDYKLNDQFSAGVEWVQYWNNLTVATGKKGSAWGTVVDATYHF